MSSSFKLNRSHSSCTRTAVQTSCTWTLRHTVRGPLTQQYPSSSTKRHRTATYENHLRVETGSDSWHYTHSLCWLMQSFGRAPIGRVLPSHSSKIGVNKTQVPKRARKGSNASSLSTPQPTFKATVILETLKNFKANLL